MLTILAGDCGASHQGCVDTEISNIFYYNTMLILAMFG
jgi:hypothetical protein